jgi:hypothetical protein
MWLIGYYHLNFYHKINFIIWKSFEKLPFFDMIDFISKVNNQNLKLDHINF